MDERYHYIEAPRPELYDVAADPKETKDLAAGHPPAFRSMRLELARRRGSFEQPTESDPERAKKLASLGYITVRSRRPRRRGSRTRRTSVHSSSSWTSSTSWQEIATPS